MAWEILAIWAIVAAAVIWFIRDERREELDKLSTRARDFATGADWRHREAAPPVPAAPGDTQRLTEIHRKFVEEMQRQGH